MPRTMMRARVTRFWLPGALAVLAAILSLVLWSPSSLAQGTAETFTVSSAGDDADADVGDGVCAAAGGECTLRAAIAEANADAATDTVEFGLSGTGPFSIRPQGALPLITSPIVINGNSQTGDVAEIQKSIELNGSDAGDADGLHLADAGNSTIRGLAINNFQGAGIRISGSGDNLIEGNYVGTGRQGNVAMPNNTGILIEGSAANRIGSETSGSDNTISGNSGNGIEIIGATAGANIIESNIIGLDASEQQPIANGLAGILIGAPQTLVNNNTIAGNLSDGIRVFGGSSIDNEIGGNFIGTLASDTFGNGRHGIFLESAPQNTLLNNRIGDQQGDGIHLVSSDNTLIENNQIGYTAFGGAVPNTGDGITVEGSDDVQILGNTLSGNNGDGASLDGESADGTIRGNLVGVDTGGFPAAGAPNGSHGLNVAGDGHLIDGNTIADNPINGVELRGNDNILINNTIGLMGAGNGNHGLEIRGSDNQIGQAGQGNTIAFNGGAPFLGGTPGGVVLNDGTGNRIQENSIHSNAGLGIDQHEDGVTTADSFDPDAGANLRQNFPFICVTGASMEVVLRSAARATFRVDLYRNTARDPSRHGEGETWVESRQVTTNARGEARFITQAVANPSGTATDRNNNTSEFGPEHCGPGGGLPPLLPPEPLRTQPGRRDVALDGPSLALSADADIPLTPSVTITPEGSLLIGDPLAGPPAASTSATGAFVLLEPCRRAELVAGGGIGVPGPLCDDLNGQNYLTVDGAVTAFGPGTNQLWGDYFFVDPATSPPFIVGRQSPSTFTITREVCEGEFNCQQQTFQGTNPGGISRTPIGPGGAGEPLTWFFNETNTDAIAERLNLSNVDNRFWFFQASLSDVQYLSEVNDTGDGVRLGQPPPNATPSNPLPPDFTHELNTGPGTTVPDEDLWNLIVFPRGVPQSGELLTAQTAGDPCAGTCLAVAAIAADGSGAVYVVDLDAVPAGTVDLTADVPGVVAITEIANARGGLAVELADLNGDTIADLAIGVPDATDTDISGVTTGNPLGAVYVLHGPLQAGPLLEQVDAVLYGPQSGSNYGADVAVGDVDRDGSADLAVAQGQNAQQRQVRLHFASEATIDDITTDGVTTTITGENLGGFISIDGARVPILAADETSVTVLGSGDAIGVHGPFGVTRAGGGAILSPGWNLVGWAGAPSGPAEATAALAGAFRSVYTWDPAAQAFRRYLPGVPGNTLETLSTGDGVWIFVTDASGAAWPQPELTAARSVPLRAGFNLVLWTGPDGTGPAAALAQLSGVRFIATYDAAGQRFLKYTPGLPASVNTLDALNYGDGVWVQIDAAATWEQPAR